MITRARYLLGSAVLALVVVAGGALHEVRADSRPIRPTEFLESLQLTVEGRERDYWSLDRERSVAFTVRGPGRVKLITRVGLVSRASKETDYEIVVRQGSDDVARGKYRVLPANEVEGAGFPAWGRHRNVTFDVPAGTHTYRVLLAGARSGIVAVRPRFLAPRRSAQRLSITPATYAQVLTLIRDEKEISYYLLTPDTPMKVAILGPTELQVNTRLDFDRKMKGRTHCYAITVRNSSEVTDQASFEVTRSQVATYRERPEVTPGVVKSMRVRLGDGLHDLEIRLTDTIARGAAVKLYLPAEDVN